MRGTVVDYQGNLVLGATVTLRGVGNHFTRTQTTNDDGSFVFKAAAPGTYVVQVEAAGFERSVIPGVRSVESQSVEVDVKLEAYRGGIPKDAPIRERVTDIKPPIVKARSAYLWVCGARSYQVKDSAGGYFMFTIHTPDMPHPITVDNPLPSPEAESSSSVSPASTFAGERPLGSTEQRLLVRLLQEWRKTAIPQKKRRKFEYYASLKGAAAINRMLESLSEADSDLLEMWYVIRELEQRQK